MIENQSIVTIMIFEKKYTMCILHCFSLSLSLCFKDQEAVLEMGQEMFYSHDQVSPDVGRY